MSHLLLKMTTRISLQPCTSPMIRFVIMDGVDA